MKLLCDENVRRSFAQLLEQEGYDVARVQDALDVGVDDSTIVEFCQENDEFYSRTTTTFWRSTLIPAYCF